MATLAVIFLHTNVTVGDYADLLQLSEKSLLFYNRLTGTMCWAVPCFFMITGSLLLKKEQVITIQICLQKYVRRIILALFLFGILFSLMMIIFETKAFNFHNIWDALMMVFQNQSFAHLWYLYSLVGAYLLLPIFKKFTDNCSKNELLYVCVLLLLFDCAVPVLDAVLGIKIAFTIWLPLRPCYYILAGHFLSEYPPKLRTWISFACAILALLVIWILNGFDNDDLLMSIETCLVVIASTSVFVTVKALKVNVHERYLPFIWKFDRLCFGVYLVHPVFIQLMYRFFHISPNSFGDSIIAILIFFIGFATVSFAVSWIMSLIMPLKKYVL